MNCEHSFESVTNVCARVGCMTPQRGIISYGLSPNQQNPLAGVARSMVFNGWRRFSNQVLYWAPPLIAAYYAMNWAIERYAFLSSYHVDEACTSLITSHPR